jgi:hypothetical protein
MSPVALGWLFPALGFPLGIVTFLLWRRQVAIFWTVRIFAVLLDLFGPALLYSFVVRNRGGACRHLTVEESHQQSEICWRAILSGWRPVIDTLIASTVYGLL